ncbi:hypothetical protein BUE80_DR006661, partial [Diplocarpon rosae]
AHRVILSALAALFLNPMAVLAANNPGDQTCHAPVSKCYEFNCAPGQDSIETCRNYCGVDIKAIHCCENPEDMWAIDTWCTPA